MRIWLYPDDWAVKPSDPPDEVVVVIVGSREVDKASPNLIPLTDKQRVRVALRCALAALDLGPNPAPYPAPLWRSWILYCLGGFSVDPPSTTGRVRRSTSCYTYEVNLVYERHPWWWVAKVVGTVAEAVEHYLQGTITDQTPAIRQTTTMVIHGAYQLGVDVAAAVRAELASSTESPDEGEEESR